MKAAFAFLACMVLLGGCVSAPPTVELGGGGEDRIHGEVADIALAPGTADRAEFTGIPLGGESHHAKYATGHVWRRVFVGGKDSPATLNVVQSKLDQFTSGAGFTIRCTYDVTAELTLANGRKFTLTATGSRQAGMMIGSAQRQSVELAVVNIARQAKSILAAH